MKQKINIYLIAILVLSLFLTMANEFFFVSNRLPNTDQSIYQYIGYIVLKGKMPYLDAFDHKGPILYLLYALACSISLEHGVWIINYFFMVTTLWTSYCISSKYINRKYAIINTFVVFSGFLLLDIRGSSPEYFCALPAALSIYLLNDYYIGELRYEKVLCIGLLSGVIFWIKHSTLITILLICFFIVIEELRKRQYKQIFSYLLFFIIGFAVVSLVVSIWLIKGHAFIPMIDDYFIANINYAGNTTLVNRLQSMVFLLFHPSVLFTFMLIIFYFIFSIFVNKKVSTIDTGIFNFTTTFVISILFLALPGRNYYHYLSSIFPLLVLICARIFFQLLKNKDINKYGLKVLLLVSSLSVVYISFRHFPSICSNSWTTNETTSQIVELINEYTDENEKISVLGYPASFYIASGHCSATNYPYISSIVLSNQERKEDYKRQIEENHPQVIISNLNEYDILGYDILSKYSLMNEVGNFKLYVLNEYSGTCDTNVHSFGNRCSGK